MATKGYCSIREYLCFCLLLYLPYFIVNGDRTSNKIYINLSGNIPCFRRLNATHQTGCASQRGGSVGILQYVRTASDLNDLLQNGTNYPFVIVIKPNYFSKFWLEEMRTSGKVSGVLLLYLKSEPLDMNHHFSPDQKCPNMNYGMYRDQWQDLACKEEWNKRGNNFLFEDWGFPIFLIRELADYNNLLQCYNDFNDPITAKTDQWPYCAAELKSNMLAAKDTKTCIRRSRLVTNLNPNVICDPIGDNNIWLTLQPTNKSTPIAEKSLIVIAARLDAASEFDGFSPGAHTTVTGLVTLMAVAESLARHKDLLTQSDYNIMFVLFNGEAFDYIGSSRMVYNMENNIFPVSLDDDIVDQPALINLTHIAYFIELSQLSQLNPKKDVYIHTDPVSSSSADIKTENAKIIKEFKRQAQYYNLTVDNSAEINPLPPASFQSFLRKRNISGIVLADHDTEFVNKYYNSVFDVASELHVSFNGSRPEKPKSLQEHLAKIASAVAGTVFVLATNNASGKIEVNDSIINDSLLCYLKKSNCQFFKDSVDPQQAKTLPEQTYPLYVSVDTYVNRITTLTLNALARLTGDVVNVTKEDCHVKKTDQIFRYIWMQGTNGSRNRSDGVCMKTTANYSKAVSPAFEIEGYDFDSGVYSTWTESIWEPTSVRIFLKPSLKWESFVFILGIFICLTSFIVVWFINRNTDSLFVQDQVIC